MIIEVELPDTPDAEWVLDPDKHRAGLRVCNDVTCVAALSWRRVSAADQPAPEGWAEVMRLALLPPGDPRHKCVQGLCDDHAG
jgi:hypothetical protein